MKAQGLPMAPGAIIASGSPKRGQDFARRNGLTTPPQLSWGCGDPCICTDKDTVAKGERLRPKDLEGGGDIIRSDHVHSTRRRTSSHSYYKKSKIKAYRRNLIKNSIWNMSCTSPELESAT
jgi:hypothetical protein